MKPFNLELAKAGHKVQTRDGRSARIICYDRKEDDGYPIVALIEDVNWGVENIEEYTINGKYDIQVLRSDNDLFMAPAKKEGYVNMYRGYPMESNGLRRLDRYFYDTLEEAKEKIDPDRDYVGTAKLEWEE